MVALVSLRCPRIGVLAVTALATGAIETPAQARETGMLRSFVYGGDASFPPHEYLDEDGRPAGFNVELVRLLAAEAGVAVEIDLAGWKDARARFDAGSVDVMSFAHSEARALRYDYLGQTWTLRQGLLFRAGRDAYPGSLQELAGEVVAVENAGGIHDRLLALPPAQRPLIHPAASHLEACRMLQRGEVTAVAGGQLTLRYYLQQLGMTDVAEVEADSFGYHLVVGQGRRQEFAALSEALDRVRGTDRYHKLVERSLALPVGGVDEASPWPLVALVGAVGVVALVAVMSNQRLRRQASTRTAQLRQSLQDKYAMARVLAESETRYRDLVESVRAIVWRADPKAFDLTFVNREAELRLGFDGASWLAPGFWLQRIHEEDREAVVASLEQAVTRREVQEFECRMISAENRTVWLRSIVQPEGAGQIEQLTGVMIDVSAAKRAEEALRDSERRLRDSERLAALGTLVGGVAHEVRNPLFGISATLDAYESKHSAAADAAAPYIASLRRPVDRLTRLMQDLLEYGKPTTLTLRPGDLGSVIDRAVEACRPMADEQTVGLEVDRGGDLPGVATDADRLILAIANVIANAISFSSDGGSVRVVVERDSPGWVELRVSDSGPGFRPEDVPHVFEPFYTQRAGGTGLGLAIVERIVHGHQGKVAAQNGVDGGAVLTIRLPAISESMAEASA